MIPDTRDFTQDKILEALINNGGDGTVHEVCLKLDTVGSWSRERISTRLNQLVEKGFVEKIPLSSLGRSYKTKNSGVNRWAYKVCAVGEDPAQKDARDAYNNDLAHGRD